MPNLITLCTDFGLKDYAVASVKGALYSEVPTCNVVDISHDIIPFHREEAAYIIRNAYCSFPKGTVHIIAVDAAQTPLKKHIVVLLDGHYFITADNGILSLITKTIKPDKIIVIDEQIKTKNRTGSSYPVLDVFVQVAAHISRGGNIALLGMEIQELKELTATEPQLSIDKNELKVPVVYIDNYGNAITSLTRSYFEEVRKGRKFTIYLPSGLSFTKIVDSYNAINDYSIADCEAKNVGRELALFNASDDLEIAIYKSNKNTVGAASNLLGLKYLDILKINFFN